MGEYHNIYTPCEWFANDNEERYACGVMGLCICGERLILGFKRSVQPRCQGRYWALNRYKFRAYSIKHLVSSNSFVFRENMILDGDTAGKIFSKVYRTGRGRKMSKEVMSFTSCGFSQSR